MVVACSGRDQHSTVDAVASQQVLQHRPSGTLVRLGLIGRISGKRVGLRIEQVQVSIDHGKNL